MRVYIETWLQAILDVRINLMLSSQGPVPLGNLSRVKNCFTFFDLNVMVLTHVVLILLCSTDEQTSW